MSLREKVAEAEWMRRRRAVGRRVVGLMVVGGRDGAVGGRPGELDHRSQM